MNFKEFSDRYEKIPVEQFPNSIVSDPVVSVCIHTYQHVNFIKDCLEGILMQNTAFPFEILLGDDASNDGTREICIAYAQKFPDKIRLFLHHRENNIYIGGSPSGRFNFLYNLYSARGKYIALCEGDDYWTDPLKLQKQFDAIEEDKNISVVSCKTIHLENGEVIGYGSGGTRTYFFTKNEMIFEMAKYSRFIFHGDNYLISALTLQGKQLTLGDTMAVWRKHPGGVWSSLHDSEENRRVLEFQRFSTKFWIGVIHFEQGRKKLAYKYIAEAMVKLLFIFPKNKAIVLLNFSTYLLKKRISKFLKG